MKLSQHRSTCHCEVPTIEFSWCYAKLLVISHLEAIIALEGSGWTWGLDIHQQAQVARYGNWGGIWHSLLIGNHALVGVMTCIPKSTKHLQLELATVKSRHLNVSTVACSSDMFTKARTCNFALIYQASLQKNMQIPGKLLLTSEVCMVVLRFCCSMLLLSL